jgi:catechol 2,3-dioxygenase-like lactoylglutathione lyase family enzyme
MDAVHLEHALVDVQNLEKSLQFYRSLLPGWGVRWEGQTWIHFGPSGDGQPGYLSLYETPAAGQAEGDGVRIEHLGFAHPDVEGLVKRVAALHLWPTDTVDDGKYRRVYFVDPDGHTLEFVQKL